LTDLSERRAVTTGASIQENLFVATNAHTRASIARYYDAFSKRLLQDYVYGNRRIELAINRVLGAADENTKLILDIGCGIGHSSERYAAHCPGWKVTGVDISPTNIETATRLFENERLRFLVSDLVENPFSERFDLISLIDVYEHIPRAHWSRFNSTLGDLLSDSGTLVLTTPTPQHQGYLHQFMPDELQIVDETVQIEDIVECARAIRATIVCYEQVVVWKRYDYLHVVMRRDPGYRPLLPSPVATRWRKRYEGVVGRFDRLHRRARVRSRLGVDITRKAPGPQA